jgi:nucleoside-diphosphate-sugar epimerase
MNFLKKLTKNINNIEPIKNQITVVYGDIRDKNTLLETIKDKDYLFNLAAQTSHADSMKNPGIDLEINCHAQMLLLEVCKDINPEIRIVHTSTRQVYGKPHYLPVDEAHRVYPVDVNGINKYSGELYHQLYHNVYGLKTTILRLTNTYGRNMQIKDARQTFLGVWIRNALINRPLEIFGSGKQIRDYTYIDDCISAMIISATSKIAIGKVYNLGGLESISHEDVAKIICSLDSRRAYVFKPFPADRKAIDIGDYYADYSLINKELGWMPKFDIKTGLKTTIKYFSENLANYYKE